MYLKSPTESQANGNCLLWSGVSQLWYFDITGGSSVIVGAVLYTGLCSVASLLPTRWHNLFSVSGHCRASPGGSPGWAVAVKTTDGAVCSPLPVGGHHVHIQHQMLWHHFTHRDAHDSGLLANQHFQLSQWLFSRICDSTTNPTPVDFLCSAPGTPLCRAVPGAEPGGWEALNPWNNYYSKLRSSWFCIAQVPGNGVTHYLFLSRVLQILRTDCWMELYNDFFFCLRYGHEFPPKNLWTYCWLKS